MPPDKETRIYGRLQNRLGQLYRLVHKYPEALAQHHQALTLAEALGDPKFKALTHNSLCEAYLRSNQYSEAKKHGLLALQLVQTLPNEERLHAFILNSMGEVAKFGGDFAAAEKHLKQAVSLRRMA